MVDSFMRNEVVGARRVVVCVGYVSQSVLERLANWLARQWKSSTSQSGRCMADATQQDLEDPNPIQKNANPPRI